MLWPSRKKMTAKKTINRNCLAPNEAGFRPVGSVVFNELAIDLILIHLGEISVRPDRGLTVVISRAVEKVPFSQRVEIRGIENV